MSTKIEWVKNKDGTPGRTWNPVTGCTPCSPGCEHCYARAMALRLKAMGIEKYANGFDVKCWHNIYLPKFKKPQTIFICSMSDLFHEKVPFEFIRGIFVDIHAALLGPVGKPGLNHRFVILTKRSGRMLEFWNKFKDRYSNYPSDYYISDHDTAPDKRIWIGVTVEDQEHTSRIKDLLRVSAAVHFVSVEPMLSKVDLCLEEGGVDWVIMGAESGPGRRPMKIEWAKNIALQCRDAGVPLFYKQGPDDEGRDFVKMPMLYGRIWDQIPITGI